MQNPNSQSDVSPLIPSFIRAVGSVFAPGMFWVFVLSLLATLAALVVFFIGATTLVSYFVDGWAALAGSFFAAMVAWFLFPGIMPIIVNFFDARIAGLIEKQDYPNARPIGPPFLPELIHDAKFSLTAIALNILVLPLYFVPVINLFVFFVLNGFLLGKEFFIMVARRHLPLEMAKTLRKQHGRLIFFAGALIALCATIPILNLFAPFWGIAVMTHLYHALEKKQPMVVLPPL